MRRIIPKFALSVALALVAGAPAGASATGPAAAPPALDGLASHAEVTGPRGTFTTDMVSLADGTTRFVQRHPAPRGTTELLALGERAFERDGKGAFVPSQPAIASFVLGHDVPRLAHAKLRELPSGERPARLEIATPPELRGGTVTIELGDWRKVAGFELPFAATFVHSAAPEDRYLYRYTAVLPFRVAPGSPLPGGAAAPTALFDRLGDFGEIAFLHETAMAAHRASDAALLTVGAAERSTISGRGRLSEATREATEARMREYLGSIRFSRYEDTAVPVVAVSADGTLGWLACEMEAEGVRTENGASTPIAYAFSWVELYSKVPDGDQSVLRWRSIGNASSQRP